MLQPKITYLHRSTIVYVAKVINSFILIFYKLVKNMLFGNIFEDNVNSHRTSEDNDIDRMRREILQNITDAQEYTREETSNASPIEFACD
jgi:hypothetical protein